MATTDQALTRGHQKKARTRRSLLRAAAEVIAERGDAFAITDVVERAGVSNGTFYNYFEDRDAVVDALVAVMIADFTAGAAELVVDDDPALRFATISATLLSWATTSPAIAGAVLRLEVFQRADLDAAMFGHLRTDLAAGVDAGVFSGAADAATVDVVGGVLLMAARRLVASGPDREYQESVIVRLLQAVGVSRSRARSVAAKAVASADVMLGSPWPG